MAYDNLFDPAIYKCWNEAIIKEQKIRVQWQKEYGSKTGKAFLPEEKDDEGVPCTCPEDFPPLVDGQMFWPRKGATGTGTLIRVFNRPPDMIAPGPAIKSKLYEGISRDGKGRYGYLKGRYKNDPEERYRSIVCTNWKYGWNHGKDNELSCKNTNCDVRRKAFDLECGE